MKRHDKKAELSIAWLITIVPNGEVVNEGTGLVRLLTASIGFISAVDVYKGS